MPQGTGTRFGQVLLAAFSGGSKNALSVDILPQGASAAPSVPQTPEIHPAVFSKVRSRISNQGPAAALTHSLFSPVFTRTTVNDQVLMTGDRPAAADTAGRAATARPDSSANLDGLVDFIFAQFRGLSRNESKLIRYSSIELAEILCLAIAASGCVLEDKQAKRDAVISVLTSLSHSDTNPQIRQKAQEVLYGLTHADWHKDKVEPVSGDSWPPDRIFELSFEKNRALSLREEESVRKAAVAGFTGLYLSVKTGALWVTLKNLKLKMILQELGRMAKGDTSQAVRKLAAEAISFLTRKGNPALVLTRQDLKQVGRFVAIHRFADHITDEQFEAYYTTEIEGPSQSTDPQVRAAVPEKCLALFQVAWVSRKLSHKDEKIKRIIEKLFVLMTDSNQQVWLNANKAVGQITNTGNTERGALSATKAVSAGNPEHDARFELEINEAYSLAISRTPQHRRIAVQRLWALYNLDLDLTDRERKLNEVVYIIQALSGDPDTLVRWFSEVALKLADRQPPAVVRNGLAEFANVFLSPRTADSGSSLTDAEFSDFFARIQKMSRSSYADERAQSATNFASLYARAHRSEVLTGTAAKKMSIVTNLKRLQEDEEFVVRFEADLAMTTVSQIERRGQAAASDLSDEDYERYFRDEIELLSQSSIPDLRRKAVGNCIDLYKAAKYSFRLTHPELKLRRIINVLEVLDRDPDTFVSFDAGYALRFIIPQI